jgi:hypothetical protein
MQQQKATGSQAKAKLLAKLGKPKGLPFPQKGSLHEPAAPGLRWKRELILWSPI